MDSEKRFFRIRAIAQRFAPARIFDGGHREHEMILAPFQPEDARKVRELLWDEYGATDVLVVNDRRVDFSLKRKEDGLHRP